MFVPGVIYRVSPALLQLANVSGSHRKWSMPLASAVGLPLGRTPYHSSKVLSRSQAMGSQARVWIASDPICWLDRAV